MAGVRRGRPAGLAPGQRLFRGAAMSARLVEALRLISEVTPDVAEGLMAINNSLLGSIPGFGEAAMKKSLELPARTRVQSTIDTVFANPSVVTEQRFEESATNYRNGICRKPWTSEWVHYK